MLRIYKTCERICNTWWRTLHACYMLKKIAHSRPPPPHSVLFRVRIYARSLPFKAPPYLRTDKIFEPPFRGLFAGFSCLKDPKSRTLLNVPPIFYFITPFLNFSGVQREIERERKKNHPFLKEIYGWKVKYPPFFAILGPDFVARKVPLYRRFWEHACGPSDPGMGGGGTLWKLSISVYPSLSL